MNTVVREIHRFHAVDGTEAWIQYEFSVELPFFPRSGDRIIFRMVLGGENGEEVVTSTYDAIERVAILRLNDTHDHELDPSTFPGHVMEMDRGRTIDGWRAVSAGGRGIELQELASASAR